MDATFAGNTSYNPASGSNTLTVNPVVTTTTLALAPNKVAEGNVGPVVFTATLKTGGVALPGGDITFQVDGNSAGASATGLNGQATWSYDPSALPLGNHTVVASFAQMKIGDITYKASNSATATLKIAPLTVWVNTTYMAGGGNDGHTFNIDAFATVQGGIDGVAPGGAVNVAAGTYAEQLTIPIPVTINGDDGAVLDGISLGLEKVGVKIKSGNVTFNNIDVVNFTGNGIIVGYPPVDQLNVHITNCKISTIQPGYSHGFGIYVGYQSEDFKRPFGNPRLTTHLDYSGLLIENNEIEHAASSALVLQSITGTPGTLVVRKNYIHDGDNDGIWIDCARNIQIEDNVIENNMDAIYISSYADNYIANAGDAWLNEDPRLPHLGGPYSPKDILITGNTISGHTAWGGIYLQSGYPETIFINENEISGNSPGIFNELTEPVDATDNWWGDASGPLHATIWIFNANPYGPHPGLGDKVTDYVLYDPWVGKLGSFMIEEVKVDFKKKPEDDKIHVKGTLIFAPGSSGLADYEIASFTILGNTGIAFSQSVPISRKGKNDRWEYKRPKGTDSGIKEFVVDVTKKKINFDIHVDNAEIGTAWTNPVFISLQIGVNYGDTSVTMDIKKDKMEYHNK